MWTQKEFTKVLLAYEFTLSNVDRVDFFRALRSTINTKPQLTEGRLSFTSDQIVEFVIQEALRQDVAFPYADVPAAARDVVSALAQTYPAQLARFAAYADLIARKNDNAGRGLLVEALSRRRNGTVDTRLFISPYTYMATEDDLQFYTDRLDQRLELEKIYPVNRIAPLARVWRILTWGQPVLQFYTKELNNLAGQAKAEIRPGKPPAPT